MNARTYAGSIAHSGGIALTRGATRVELTEFAIGIDGTPELTALVGGTRVPILTVDLAALKATASTAARSRSRGAALKLTAAAAGALNQAFSTTAFTEGLLLGTATVAADTNALATAVAREPQDVRRHDAHTRRRRGRRPHRASA